MLSIDLTGKICVITGGGGQLGRVMVRTLADCGADVAIHYLTSREQAEKLRTEVQAMGRRAIAVQADVSKKDDVNRMRDAVVKELGEADVIVNNAVVQYKWVSVLEQGLEDYESQYRSCVVHNVLMAKAFVPGMIKKGRGRVIGINTECTMQCHPSQSAYIAGKAGMDRVLRVLAKEVGAHQITVNQVAPGWTISDRDRELGTEVNEAHSRNIPLKRRGTDQELANVVAFLASDLSSYVTGAFIPVCGGNVMPTI